MNYPISTPIRISEIDIAGRNFLATPEAPFVRVTAERIGAEAVKFCARSEMEIGRDLISAVMTNPLYEINDWEQVEQGLRSTTYPSRAVKKLQATTAAKDRLYCLRSASIELANILKATEDADEFREFVKAWRARGDTELGDLSGFLHAWGKREETGFELPTVNEEYKANIPIFSNGEAIRYAEDFLLSSSPATVARLLKEHISHDPKMIRAFELLSSPLMASASMPGLSQAELVAIRNSVMRDENRLGWIEIVHKTLDRLFVAIKEEASFDDLGPKGGGYDNTVYVRSEDMPKHFQDKEGDIRILIGASMRDPDRKTGLPRNRVKFIRRKSAVVGHPQVAWVNDNGKKRLVYPSSPYEPSVLRPIIARPNSLVGAAIFANLVGVPDMKVNYSNELDRLIGRRSKYSAPLARAGMLGLVLHTRQEELLRHPYFQMIEERALQ